MKKIAVFGKPGSGKSTLSKNLEASTGLPLCQLDSLIYNADGCLIDSKIYQQKHDNLLNTENWIIDGFGPIDSFYKRLNRADTLIYIDLPYLVSYWLVTKRFFKGIVVKPEGWPDSSSILKGSINSYKTLRLCPKFWNSTFENKLSTIAANKKLFKITTLNELNSFSHEIKRK